MSNLNLIGKGLVESVYTDNLMGVPEDTEFLVNEFIEKCGYSRKEAIEAANNVIFEEDGL